MKTRYLYKKIVIAVLLAITMLYLIPISAKALTKDDYYCMAASGKPMILLPDSLYGQINTISFNISIFQTNTISWKNNMQLVYAQSFIKLTNTNYFESLGEITLNGEKYHVYGFINTDYNISLGFYAYIHISETYSNYKLGTFDRIKPCQEDTPTCPSRFALWQRYKYFFSSYVGNKPFEALNQTTQEEMAKLLNWFLGYTSSSPDYNDWIEVLKADTSSIIKPNLPANFGCSLSNNYCSCMKEIEETFAGIASTNQSAILHVIDDQFKVNAMTSCNCLANYYPITNKEETQCIFTPKGANYPFLIIDVTLGEFNTYFIDSNGRKNTFKNAHVKIGVCDSNETSYCAGVPITLCSSGKEPYHWSTGDTTSSIIITLDSTSQYTVTATNLFGCIESDTINIEIVASPDAEAGEPTTVCPSDTITLNASGGTAYHWSTSDSTASIRVAPDSTYQYFVTVTNESGCTAIDSVTVTVSSIPEAEAGPNDTICRGIADTLKATGGESYLWSTNEATATIVVSPDSTAMYYVTVSNGCFSAKDSVTITVNTLPTAEAGLNDTICAGVSDTLTAIGGTNYHWSTGDSTASILITPTASTTYTVTVYNSSGCFATDNVYITVNPLPTVNAGQDHGICTGITDTLTAEGGPPYRWNTNDTTANLIITPDSTHTYIVSVTNLNGCKASDSITVTVNSYAIAEAGNDISICKGKTDTLTASGGNAYLWSNNATTASIAVSPDSTKTYRVTVLNNGCPDTDSVKVSVNLLPVAEAGPNSSICFGFADTLTASGGSSYHWSTGDSTASIIVSPSVTNIYTVTVGNSNSCTETDVVTVTVFPQPNADAGFNVSIAQGDTTSLTASGGTHYHWNTNDSLASITVSPSTATIYYVTVTDVHGCVKTDDVTVLVGTSVLPNAEGYWQRNDSTITTIAGIGRVGIGTDNPSEKLSVVGNMSISGDIILGGNNKRIAYTPATLGNPEILSFGSIPAPGSFSIPCANPTTTDFVTQNQFHYKIISTGYALNNDHSENLAYPNVMQMGFDGNNGIIDIAGSNPESDAPKLYINALCGKDVIVGNNGSGTFTANNSSFLALSGGSNVGIGTNSTNVGGTDYKLAVKGKIVTQEVIVTLTGWSDYVLEKKYKLTPLAEVEKYINDHKHLPDVPSAEEVAKNGVALGETQALLLKKIEELTLYIIEINKQLELLKKKNEELQKEVYEIKKNELPRRKRTGYQKYY